METCPLCFWQDDEFQFVNPDYSEGVNPTSLNESKKLSHQGYQIETGIVFDDDPEFHNFPPSKAKNVE